MDIHIGVFDEEKLVKNILKQYDNHNGRNLDHAHFYLSHWKPQETHYTPEYTQHTPKYT